MSRAKLFSRAWFWATLELEVGRVAAAVLSAAGVGVGLAACAHGHVVDEAIAGRHGGAGRCRTIGRVFGAFARFFAAARHLAVHPRATETRAVVGAAELGLARVEGCLETVASRGKVTRIRVLEEAREVGRDIIGALGRVASNLPGTFRVAIAAEGAIERLELVAHVRAVLCRIAAARASGATAAGAARAAGASDLAAARHCEERDHHHEEKTDGRK